LDLPSVPIGWEAKIAASTAAPSTQWAWAARTAAGMAAARRLGDPKGRCLPDPVAPDAGPPARALLEGGGGAEGPVQRRHAWLDLAVSPMQSRQSGEVCQVQLLPRLVT
jgi:hypothetical protein